MCAWCWRWNVAVVSMVGLLPWPAIPSTLCILSPWPPPAALLSDTHLSRTQTQQFSCPEQQQLDLMCESFVAGWRRRRRRRRRGWRWSPAAADHACCKTFKCQLLHQKNYPYPWQSTCSAPMGFSCYTPPLCTKVRDLPKTLIQDSRFCLFLEDEKDKTLLLSCRHS